MALVNDLNRTLGDIVFNHPQEVVLKDGGDYEAPGDAPAREGNVDKEHGSGYAFDNRLFSAPPY